MSLKQKLQEDLKSSMKNKDTVRKSVVTLIRASIKQKILSLLKLGLTNALSLAFKKS